MPTTDHSSKALKTEYKGIKDQLILNTLTKSLINHDLDDVFFLCIGTDRSTGDSFGPIIGSMLRDKGYKNVWGTLEYPIHAQNLRETVEQLPEDKVIIAIDAMLGRVKNIGTIGIRKGSLRPGAGVGKDLGEIGDYSITGVVNVAGYMEFFVLQNTRLASVVALAKLVVRAIEHTFPLVEQQENALTI